MNFETVNGILIPFLGTSLGAACVYLLKKDLSPAVARALNGFASGVMVAASIWSLLIPAIERKGGGAACDPRLLGGHPLSPVTGPCDSAFTHVCRSGGGTQEPSGQGQP